ncbi:MAG TPA: HlyD family efflux transporter periplasmic adaptor subunit [Polyangia bacterium]|jgi:HlyD family secretion protein|nr:HlyD family efflux transporter periplasmic adaptor subunit [Polyangia bacterium]
MRSRAQLDVLAAAARLNRQEAYGKLARGLLARRTIRAPTDGIIVARSFEKGETIQASPPGPPLFVLDARPGHLLVRADLDEAYAARLRSTKARVLVPSTERSLVGEVLGVRTGSASPAELRSEAQVPPRHEVHVAVENLDGTLVPGSSAVVELEMASPPRSLRVPLAMVSGDGDAARVLWVVRGAGPPTPLPVTTGVDDGQDVEVSGAGLEAGQRVALRN